MNMMSTEAGAHNPAALRLLLLIWSFWASTVGSGQKSQTYTMPPVFRARYFTTLWFPFLDIYSLQWPKQLLIQSQEFSMENYLSFFMPVQQNWNEHLGAIFRSPDKSDKIKTSVTGQVRIPFYDLPLMLVHFISPSSFPHTLLCIVSHPLL